MSESLILFDGKYYQLIDEVAMGSPLGPTLTSVFLCYHEQIWLENCPLEIKPVVYRRYLDDTFLLFRTRKQIKKFFEYLNCQHSNLKFTFKVTENNTISFLHIKITRKNNNISTSIYRKLWYLWYLR